MDTKGRYKMGSFTRMTGLSSALLRAWERRYGLLRPERLPSGHRMYTEEDLAVVEGVKTLLDSGSSIGEIAARKREALLPGTFSTNAPPTAQAVDLPGEALRAHLVRAAAEIDLDLLRHSLDELFARLSPLAAVVQVIEPAAREIGERWASGDISVAGEHLVSSYLAFRLRQLLETAQGAPRKRRRSVLCACLPAECHELGLLVVALRIAASGFNAVYLGTMLPISELERACETLAPASICLSVSRSDALTAQTSALVRFAGRWADRLAIHLGGLGVVSDQPGALTRAGVTLWPTTRRLDEFLEALTSPPA